MPSFLFFLLFLLILLLLNGTVQSNTCSTEGFMDLSLLETKTGTNNNGQTTHQLSETIETRWIITEEIKRFNCSGDDGTLTEVLVGVDIRTVTSNRNQYPRIEIWRERSRRYTRTKPSKSPKTHTGRLKRRIKFYKRSFVLLILSPQNFTTNGLYRYTLPTPLTINSYTDYRLGVFQPPDDRSVVRFYKVNEMGEIGRVNDGDIDEYSITKSREIRTENSSILIHPINMSMLIIMNFINNNFSTL